MPRPAGSSGWCMRWRHVGYGAPGRRGHRLSERRRRSMCWRSATIVNDLLGEEFYDLKDDCSFVEWGNSQQFEPHAHKISA